VLKELAQPHSYQVFYFLLFGFWGEVFHWVVTIIIVLKQMYNMSKLYGKLTLPAALVKASLWDRPGLAFLTLASSVFMNRLYGLGVRSFFSFFGDDLAIAIVMIDVKTLAAGMKQLTSSFGHFDCCCE
jgi:hypothetical protein